MESPLGTKLTIGCFHVNKQGGRGIREDFEGYKKILELTEREFLLQNCPSKTALAPLGIQ